jgi:putative ABC transport system ATP-binding protein
LDIMSNTRNDVELLELTGVTKEFPVAGGRFTAVRSLDLSVARGEFLAVVGKSGSGKSTLLHLIAGIDRPTAGQVRVGGTPVHALDESALASWRGRNVGVVFQFFQLLPALTVLENVMLPMDFCGTLPPSRARARALQLLKQMEIADQAGKLPAALSGGQQQRAAVARALANEPALLLADEPTGNLDSETAASMLDLLASLAKSGRTVIMVTHERDVRRIADRTITLVDGQIAAQERAGESAGA